MDDSGLGTTVIEFEVADHIATIWLDRPEQRNALGRAFWSELPEVARTLSNRDDVRVVVVAARGRDFTIGLDLKEMGGSLASGDDTQSRAATNQRTYQAVRSMQDAVSSLAHLPVPVIAAVHGLCLGGGVDLITACDIRLASEDAVFSIRETKVAIVADLGTLQRLPRLIGAGHVAELAYTGEDIGSARAAEIGLVNRVAGRNADEVYVAAIDLAVKIAANSPLAVRGTKSVLAANDGRTVDEGLEFVAAWNTMYLSSNDLREAMSAFLERRPPVFRGD